MATSSAAWDIATEARFRPNSYASPSSVGIIALPVGAFLVGCRLPNRLIVVSPVWIHRVNGSAGIPFDADPDAFQELE
jgi:hypothetical protein